MVLYSKDAAADRAFFREVLGFDNIDVGGGWLVFKMPPAEAAFHPAETGGSHELYFTCEDVVATKATLEAKGVACGPVNDEGWGILSSLTLPGGGSVGFYQPRHETIF